MPTMTITTTAEQAQRVSAAVGNHLQLVNGSGQPRNATAEEIRQFVIAELRGIVLRYERKTAEQAAFTTIGAATPFEPT